MSDNTGAPDVQRIEHSAPEADLPAPAPSDPGSAVPLTGEACAQSAANATHAGNGADPKPPATRREFEHALRSLGFTKRAAAAIAANGFRAGSTADADGEPEPELAALTPALARLAAALFKD